MFADTMLPCAQGAVFRHLNAAHFGWRFTALSSGNAQLKLLHVTSLPCINQRQRTLHFKSLAFATA